MEITIDLTKSAQANAVEYFERYKKAKKKAEGAEHSVKELESRLREVEGKTITKKELKKVEKREWYERFNWFFTSNGLLVIGGRSADQNEELNSRYFEENDLFFHADLFGASVTILKNGVDAEQPVKEEVAQFAASFSKAWENGLSSVDVYALKRDQVTKSRNKGSLGKGSFLLVGDREWFKAVPLRLAAFIIERDREEQVLQIAPAITCLRLGIKHYLVITLGNTKKSDAAKFIAKELKYANLDYIMQHLPAGPFSVKKFP